jgi:hypothetical protein
VIEVRSYHTLLRHSAPIRAQLHLRAALPNAPLSGRLTREEALKLEETSFGWPVWYGGWFGIAYTARTDFSHVASVAQWRLGATPAPTNLPSWIVK